MDLSITCLCGTIDQVVRTRPEALKDGLTLCHCDHCRYTSGVLCMSYYPIAAIPTSLDLFKAYKSSHHTTRYFCKTCGCHVFKARETSSGDAWSVATGTIAAEPASDPAVDFTTHAHVSDTKDGGLSIWLPKLKNGSHKKPTSLTPYRDNPTLAAGCHCGAVSFQITPPEASSQKPHPSSSDLLIPLDIKEESIPKEQDQKWWLRPVPTSTSLDPSTTYRYLAVTCACRSCRLATGFEIQTWAFVPASNIYFHVPPDPQQQVRSIDFPTLNAKGILQTYRSSPDVMREFCPVCGATVFWHDTDRPYLIDVSAGLLRLTSTDSIQGGGRGSRASAWLAWTGGGVSNRDECRTGRSGAAADRAEALIADLREGVRAWGAATSTPTSTTGGS